MKQARNSRKESLLLNKLLYHDHSHDKLEESKKKKRKNRSQKEILNFIHGLPNNE